MKWGLVLLSRPRRTPIDGGADRLTCPTAPIGPGRASCTVQVIGPARGYRPDPDQCVMQVIEPARSWADPVNVLCKT